MRPVLSRTALTTAAVGSALALAGLAPPAGATPGALPPGATDRPAASSPSPAAVSGRAARLRALQERAVRYVGRGRSGPQGPNPALALVPDARRLDWAGWRAAQERAGAEARARSRARATAAAQREAEPLTVLEDEPRGSRGSNDSLATAQPVTGLGTAGRSNPRALLVGRLSPDPLEPGSVEAVRPNREDDGSFETARDTGVSRSRAGIRTTGRIGDAPPPRPGAPRPDDADLYELTLRAGDLVDVSMRRTGGTLDPLTFLVDASGNTVTFPELGEDQEVSTFTGAVRTAGTYYVVTVGWTVIDLDTGEVTKPNGSYALTITARPGDRDVYAVSARPGDVIGVSLADAAGYASVFDRSGAEVHGSGQDASAAYPAASPLPGGGNAVTEHVVRTAGTHYVEVTAGDGLYSGDVEVYRYGGAAGRARQTVFLDTDGQRLNTGIFGGRGVTRLSPLRAFLGRWGLPRTAERALVDRVKATVQENLDRDLRAAGLGSSVGVRVVTSQDGPDPSASAGVTRLVVGGTIAESGVPTIGVAQSIDPGNYEREETGLVLLDSLSAPADRQRAPYSLNTYLTGRSDRLGFLGRAIGNVASHEVGHMIGNWHVDETNDRADLMDASGNFPQLFGVGRDGVGGTADDRDVDFGADRFSPFEGFAGIEDTRNRSSWGLSRRP